MKSFLFLICLIVPTILLAAQKMDVTGPQPHGLNFSELPTSWDEGIPLGNGILGALIWQKEGKLRFYLDRTDLWDERPVKNLSLPEFS